MPIELSEIHRLQFGRLKQMFAGELPRHIALYLSVNPGLVYIGDAEIQKVFKKHPDIDYQAVQLVFLMIKNGKYYTDRRERKCVTVIWTDELTEKTYVISLKAANSGEVWLQTMYRSDMKKVQKRTKDCTHLIGA